jgi:outer membrane protein
VRPAYAQEISVPARLTLRDAIEIARERNPDYQQALNTYHAQGAQVRAGWGAFLPTLSARMSFAGSDSRTVTGQDDYGQPVELPAPITFQGSSSNQSVSAGITLFDGLRNLHSLRSARASQAAADAARWAARTRLDAETTRRFYDALRAAQLIALEERLLASAKEQYANTERLFRTASATQEDLLGAEADVLNQELQLDQAQGTARKALLALRELLGITEPIDFEVAGDLPAVWDPETLAADSLVSVALAEHPQLQQLEANANAAELRAAAAHGGYWPRIQAAASFSRSVNLGSYQALFDLNPRNRSFGFSLSLDLPLFTGFQTSAQVAQASADAENAEATLRAGALALERDVRAALVDLKNAYRALALAERASELSSERLRLSRERYAIGAITFANLQLLIDRAAQQERQLTNARYGYAAAVATLDERVGQVVRP